MELALRAAFTVLELIIENESYLHAGHAGDNGTGNSHFFIRLKAEEFRGMSLVARHRAVYQVLDPFIKRGVHALKFDLKSA